MQSSRQRFAEFRSSGLARSPDMLEPKPPRPARGERWKNIREYLGWLRPFRRAIALIYTYAIVSAVFSLALPVATRHIIDTVLLKDHDWTMLNVLGGSLLVLIIAQQIFDFLRNWNTAKLNARFLFRLRQRMYEHLLRLPLHQLSNLKTGGITSRLSGDVDSVTGMLQMAVITPAVAFTKVSLTVVLLMFLEWRLAIAAMLLLPGVIVLNVLYIRRVRPIYRSMRKDRGEIDGRVVETFGGIRVVRAFGRERTESLRYAIRHHTVIRKTLLAQLLEQFVWSGWGLLIPIGALMTIWYGGVLVLQDITTIGAIVAFQMYLLMLLSPVSALVRSYGETQQALAATERILDILRQPIDKPDRPNAVVVPRRVEHIAFDNVSFAYRPDQPVLQGVTIDIPGGTSVALVGPSGAGKTTVTNLVARFADPDEGAVRLNGIDLRDIKLRSFRSLLGLVQQDIFLFDGTVAENIAYGRPTAEMEEVIDAAKRANAHDFISQFPEGYETLVGERGVKLSGGQAQRVSIARAILADPQILILDEATSNLDTESEQLIQAALSDLLADRTTFIIAHRLSTVVRADQIVVLEAGRVIETGTHEQLLAADGRYRAMVERQQRGFDQPGDEVAATSWLE